MMDEKNKYIDLLAKKEWEKLMQESKERMENCRKIDEAIYLRAKRERYELLNGLKEGRIEMRYVE